MKIIWRSSSVVGIMVGAALLGGIGAAARAQTGKPAPTKPAMGGKGKPGAKHDSNGAMKRLLAQLNLTPDQVTKLQAVEAKNKTTVAGIQANKTLTPDQKKTLVRAESKNVRTEAEKILTPAQRDKFKMLVMQAALERKNKMAAKGGVPGTLPTPHAIK